MKPGWIAPELRRFVRDVRLTRDRGAIALCAAIAVYGLLAASQPASGTIRSLALDRDHQRLPYVAWAALQPWPAMYNFENRVVLGLPQPDGSERPLGEIWLNHHVTRVLYEVGAWPPLSVTDGCFDYLFLSRYRGQHLVTPYRACRRGTTYTIRRLERSAR